MLIKIKRTFGFILSHKLARKNKLRAFTELIYWQIQTTLFATRTFRKKFAGRLTVLVSKRQTGMTGNLYSGLHEFNDMGFLLHFLRPEDLFIDAGANVGSYTLLASGVTGSKTIAFEPVPCTFQNLKNNISVNQLNRLVDLRNMGLSSEKGILAFSSLLDTTNHVVKDDSHADSIPVPVDTLDAILNVGCASLLKIDVEGFETEVLNGAAALLSNETLKAIIIELNGSGNRYGYSDWDIHTKLVKLGFNPYDYDPFTRNLDKKDHFGTSNTIYIRDEEFVIKRVQTSEPIKIFGVTF